MTAKSKILILVAALALGFGIYAISGDAGNNQTAKKDVTPSEEPAFRSLKSLTTGDMAAMRILDTPLDLTKINFTDGNGKTFTIADWKGRTVLLNLWATWCPPCRHEMPSLEDLEKRAGSDVFEVVSVSIDLKSPDKPRAFFKEINLTELKFYWDGTSKIFHELKKMGLAFGMPTTILIDKNGMAIGAMNGPAEWNSKAAFALIEKAIALPDN